MQKIILTTKSAMHFGIRSGQINIGRFPGGEVSLAIKENLEGGDVFIIGSTNAPAENLIELLLAIDTARRKKARNISVIIPYFGYSRADREKFSGDSVSAETMAKLIEAVGGNSLSVYSFDIHSKRVGDFFKVPFENIEVTDPFVEKFSSFSDFSVVAPDKGAEERALGFARKIGKSKIAVIQKNRLENREVIIEGIEGEVGERVLIIDDIIDSGGTILAACGFLKKEGVKSISIVATHMVWQGGGWKRLLDSTLVEKVYTTDTIMPPQNIPAKIEIFSIRPILENIFFSE